MPLSAGPRGAGNIVSGNTTNGIFVQNGATSATIQGNVVGLDVTGATALGNGGSGVVVNNSTSATIGGTTAAERNVVSANATRGILVRNGAAGAIVQGNYVGTDATGTTARGNNGGIIVDNAPAVTIGGTATVPANLVSGNTANGIVIQGAASTGTTVRGNLIGTDAAGTAALANGTGIETQGVSNITIGGIGAGEPNTIAFNTGSGVQILSGTSCRPGERDLLERRAGYRPRPAQRHAERPRRCRHRPEQPPELPGTDVGIAGVGRHAHLWHAE